MGCGGSKAAGKTITAESQHQSLIDLTELLDRAHMTDTNPYITRSLTDLPVHVTTEHIIGFLDIYGLIRLSATCRRWYTVQCRIFQKKPKAECAAMAMAAIPLKVLKMYLGLEGPGARYTV